MRTYIDIQHAELLARLHEPTRASVLFALGDHHIVRQLAREAIHMMAESSRDAEWAGRGRASADLVNRGWHDLAQVRASTLRGATR